MITDKDKDDIQKGKKLIEEQVEETKKLDLGLDADGSSKGSQEPNSKFDGFINENDLPRLGDK
jgi:hypothetical protein|nr:hypothetical protein [uncultured Pedobacter sp.]